jgi:carboxymethylenebutenolidase
MAALAEGAYQASVTREVLDVDGVAVETIAAAPATRAAGGAIVVIPDIMGLRPLFEDLCRRLATHGRAVRAIEPFAEIAASERAQLDVAARMQRVPQLRDQRMLQWTSAAADRAALETESGASSVIGFCMGGYFCFKAAASGRFASAVSFYGMIRTPQHWRGDYLQEPLETIRETCPTLAILGGKDPWTPPADVEALRVAWAGFPGHQIVVYPEAEHGFVHDPDRPAHRPDDAADAWRRALAFCGVPASP